MYELYEAAFSGVNVVYTTLLILVLVYWTVVILGVIDLDTFDIDLGADVDVGGVDMDGDFGPNIDGDAATGGSGGFSWLAFFNVGEAPIMFFISIVILTMWVVSVQLNHLIDEFGPSWMNYHQIWLAVALAVPNFLFAMFVAKFAVLPLKRYRTREPQQTRLKGKVGIITTEEANERFGRCELPKQDGSLIFNVRTRDGEVLRKGDPVEILNYVRGDRGDYCVVTRKNWE